MEKAGNLKILAFVAVYTIALSAQTIINFDDQGWTNNQILSSEFVIDNFTYSSSQNFYTNYGNNFNVNTNSLYYVFQKPDSDKIIIKTPDNSLVKFNSVDVYQVSETSTDSLIIEGWKDSVKVYSEEFYGLYSWQVLKLNYDNINKIVIKLSPGDTTQLTDYNFDNFSFTGNSLTSLNKPETGPKDYTLSQNYPNPFNPSTKIDYSLPKAGNVVIKVYDMLGKEVATLVDGYRSAGSYSTDFNAANLSSGIYVYELRSNKFVSIKKMILLK